MALKGIRDRRDEAREAAWAGKSRLDEDAAERPACLVDRGAALNPTTYAIRSRHPFEHRLIHRTARGDLVRSISEVVVADALHAESIDYHYEKALRGPDGVDRYPDFTAEDPASGVTVYWEHLGMLSNPEYARRWKEKLEWYGAMGLEPDGPENDKGERLVISENRLDGAIDSAHIRGKVREVFGLLARRSPPTRIFPSLFEGARSVASPCDASVGTLSALPSRCPSWKRALPARTGIDFPQPATPLPRHAPPLPIPEYPPPTHKSGNRFPSPPPVPRV
jgi:hypothetical protein